LGGNNLIGTSTNLTNPNAVAWNAAQNRLIIADTGNCLVRAQNAATMMVAILAGSPGVCGHSGDGNVGTFASIDTPRGLSVDAVGNIFIACDVAHHIRMLWANGTIITILGQRNVVGPPMALESAASARLNRPRIAAVDAHGHLW
jgi:sugar lactone lactonase YvrE